jgi:hypothetical protein
MAKLAVRLLILSMFTTSLLVIPAVTPAKAMTTSTKHIKKKRVRVTHQNPSVAGPSAKSYSNNPYEDDEDRRRANGGGGGY